MGLRVLATLIITFLGAVGAFFEAFYGLIAYSFWSYTYPENATWGMIPVKGLSYLTGLLVIWSTVMQKKRLFSDNSKNIMILVFWFLCLMSVFTAGLTDIATWQFKFFSRVILIALVITVLVDDIKKLKYYLWVIVIFIGAVAAKSGIIGTVKGYIGGATWGFEGVIGDRNFMAVILCSIIPIIFYMMRAERSKLTKTLLFVVLIGDIMALQLTYARAGFVGFIASGFFIIAKSKHKIIAGVLAILVGSLLMAHIVSKEYLDRISTISTYENIEDKDLSSAGRLIAWRSSIEMIKDKPLTGVGFYNSDMMMEKYPDPKTGRVLTERAIHNSVLQVGAEIGLPALILYLSIFFIIYRMLGRIKKKAQAGLLSQEISHYALMFQVSFVGFFASAFFVNAAFIDISWHLAGLTIALEQIANKEIAQKASI